jgi:hypothetical protein
VMCVQGGDVLGAVQFINKLGNVAFTAHDKYLLECFAQCLSIMTASYLTQQTDPFDAIDNGVRSGAQPCVSSSDRPWKERFTQSVVPDVYLRRSAHSMAKVTDSRREEPWKWKALRPRQESDFTVLPGH